MKDRKTYSVWSLVTTPLVAIETLREYGYTRIGEVCDLTEADLGALGIDQYGIMGIKRDLRQMGLGLRGRRLRAVA